jgi:hypothetical protein
MLSDRVFSTLRKNLSQSELRLENIARLPSKRRNSNRSAVTPSAQSQL